MGSTPQGSESGGCSRDPLAAPPQGQLHLAVGLGDAYHGWELPPPCPAPAQPVSFPQALTLSCPGLPAILPRQHRGWGSPGWRHRGALHRAVVPAPVPAPPPPAKQAAPAPRPACLCAGPCSQRLLSLPQVRPPGRPNVLLESLILELAWGAPGWVALIGHGGWGGAVGASSLPVGFKLHPGDPLGKEGSP